MGQWEPRMLIVLSLINNSNSISRSLKGISSIIGMVFMYACKFSLTETNEIL